MKRGIGVAAVLAAVIVTTGTSQVVSSPAAEAAVPCSVTQGSLPDPVDLAPGASVTRTFVVIPPDDRADLTLADLDVYLGFVDYVAGPEIHVDHAGESVQLMGPYPTGLPPQSFSITYDDAAPTPLGQQSPSGRYQPPAGFKPLRAFNGTKLGGSYTLRIYNSSGADVHLRDWKLVMAPNTCDSDGDGVEQSADNCPTVGNADQLDWDADGVGNACDPTPGTAPGPPTGTCTSGCAYARTVGLRHKEARHRLVGKVESVAVGCESGVPVTIWRKRSGADRKLLVVTTRATGAFRTKAPRRAGRYYAAVGSAAEPLCGHDTSRVVRIRRR